MHVYLSLVKKFEFFFILAAFVLGAIYLTIIGGKANIRELNVSFLNNVFQYHLEK